MTSERTTVLQKKEINSIHQKLDEIPFNKPALASGFKKRNHKKITGKALLVAFILMALQGNNSLQLWAEKMGGYTGKDVSKQAIWKRLTGCFVRFLSSVLSDMLHLQVSQVHRQAIRQGWVKKYKRILIQDSTTIALPVWLRWCYPGNTSKGEKKSQLKIQVICDLLNNRFVHFEITPFTANDQSRSKDILQIAGRKDRVIRDLGYFSLDCFDRMNGGQIHFISRLKYGIKITDAQTGKAINLLKILRKQKRLDRWVWIGEKQQLYARLAVLPLPREQADQRRYKAKHDRDKRMNHSKEYYEQLGYSLFITTESRQQLSAVQIAKAYGLRWRIESIFKCWKSQFHLQRLIPQHTPLTRERTEAIIYMMLIFILLFQVTVYNYLIPRAGKTCIISLTKLSRYIADNIHLFFEKTLSDLEPRLLRYCAYEKRNDRLNFVQKLKLS